jgi:hypothetical protein
MFKTFHDANDFLRTVEQDHPLGSHANFHEAWEDDVYELAGSGLSKEEQLGLDAALSIREKIHAAAVGGTVSASKQESSWEWLLTVPQVPQRTTEWYEEKRNILTASELATIFKGGRTRGALIMAKAAPVPEGPIAPPRLAVEKRETGPLDWGVRYEPVVKKYLEKSLGAKILDLGRIHHRSVPRLAASPDGIFSECSAHPELVGRLVEIKCPSTRVIKEDVVPFEYWCQMQIQMEVCDRDGCEYVEVKFKEIEEPSQGSLDHGWITLESNIHTGENRYLYHDTAQVPEQDAEWAPVETYMWEITQVRRVTVVRDPAWFAGCAESFATFWKDVESARAGTFEMPAGRLKKVKEEAVIKCAIVDDESTVVEIPIDKTESPEP